MAKQAFQEDIANAFRRVKAGSVFIFTEYAEVVVNDDNPGWAGILLKGTLPDQRYVDYRACAGRSF